MKVLLARLAVAVAIAFWVIGGSVEAWAERRVALVVGNATYAIANISLTNPRNDAEDVSAALKSLGFEVITAVNATRRDMDLALQRFARLATDADAALFFYAGHAMQFQGRNFLMPTDAELEDEISVRYQTVGLEDVRAALDRANGVKIMILDACRNNPLADRLQKSLNGTARSLAATRGLARLDKTQGMVVAYATAADDVAQDGQGRNSPFTAALLKRLQEPGLEIEMMFRRVAYDVNMQTGGRQRPETYISLLSEYYLNQSDRIIWDRIKDQDDVAALREFVNKYPSSPHAIFARNRLDLLERFAREREEARRAREEEQRRTAEAEIERRREAEDRRRAEQLAAQQRIEEEQKRQEAKQVAALEAAKLEAARQEPSRRQQEGQMWQEAVRLLQEQRQQEVVRQQQEEPKQADLERRRTEENCRREEAKLSDLRSAGASSRGEMAKFETATECKSLRPAIAAAIAQEAPPSAPSSLQPSAPLAEPVKVNVPEQIRQAQVELVRLGCFSGPTDGKLSDATRGAIRSLSQRLHRRLLEISITNDFIADLKRQADHLCAPPRKPISIVTASHSEPPQSLHNSAKEAAAAQPPAPPQPARATVSTAIGVGF
jgi:Caspase domain